ncbi:Asp23/Gls24 family envelope stress response protein [Solicola sp. PLA-1-18]|uniref:Asp23/Gls24 family envelope stress response protein n=1 Tax=Solicola sp. PLA-1-18 TaxID=3380532 RepID=UPI003B76CFC7
MAEAPAAERRAAPDEPFALSDATGGADRPAAERGTLDVKSKAITHIAERAAGETDGTVRSATTAQKALGRGYPRASVRVDRNRAWVDLDVAVTWPAPVSTIAAQVRDSVIRRTSELSGLDVRRVDVTIHVVTGSATADDDNTRRRVQ